MEENIQGADRVGFDASPFEIMINDENMVGGKLSVTLIRNDATDPLSASPQRTIMIDGILAMTSYEQDIRKIETRRYVIDGIDVYSEEFGSLGDDIVYRFHADSFRVKYQLDESPEELEMRS